MNLKFSNNRAGRAAFTMIEIAIALAVIAFALVAIIGVLPTGINVQKDNREDTIVNQDGPYWIEAIRSGTKGLDYLTNYVDIITIESKGRFNGNVVNQTVIYTNAPGLITPTLNGSMTNGRWIIGLLSRPRFEGDVSNVTNRITNSVTARVRALTGSAVEQGTNNRDFSFSYLLVPEVIPFAGVQVPVASTNFTFQNEAQPPVKADLDAAVAARKAEWVKVKSREKNTWEVRLAFRWPLLANGQTGPNYQRFRVLAAGQPENSGVLTFLQPQSFAAVPTP